MSLLKEVSINNFSSFFSDDISNKFLFLLCKSIFIRRKMVIKTKVFNLNSAESYLNSSQPNSMKKNLNNNEISVDLFFLDDHLSRKAFFVYFINSKGRFLSFTFFSVCQRFYFGNSEDKVRSISNYI